MSAKRPQLAAVINARFGKAAKVVPVWETASSRRFRKVREFFSGFAHPFQFFS